MPVFSGNDDNPPVGDIKPPSAENSYKHTNLSEAVKAKALADMMELLEKGKSLDERDTDGNTALHWAVWRKSETALTQLLNRGARCDAVNKLGQTPIHWAALNDNVHALDLMTKNDRSLLSIRDADGMTPFLLSAQFDFMPTLEWYYLNGVNMEESDDFGRNALHWACHTGQRRVVQYLVSRGADISQRDHTGETALHWTYKNGHHHCTEVLTEVGSTALINVPDANGDTPLDIAGRLQMHVTIFRSWKQKLFTIIFGRPFIFRSYLPTGFMIFMAGDVTYYSHFIAPHIYEGCPPLVLTWVILTSISLFTWVMCLFSDPGTLTEKTIKPQSDLLGTTGVAGFDPEQPVESQMAFRNSVAGRLCAERYGGGKLGEIELEQQKLGFQRQIIQQAKRRHRETGYLSRLGHCGVSQCEVQHDYNFEHKPLINGREDIAPLERASEILKAREGATAEEVARARLERIVDEGRGEYATLVDNQEFKSVCTICRVKRTMRSHHCKECGRCVDRLDHHCPWIDNCVGLRNQRAFYVFISTLFVALILFYVSVLAWFWFVYAPIVEHGTWMDLWNSLRRAELSLEGMSILMFAACGMNGLWLYFVSSLIVRHSVFMAVNITTYESLIKPLHIQRRFRNRTGKYWYLHKLTVWKIPRRIWSYWTLDGVSDAKDYRWPPAGARADPGDQPEETELEKNSAAVEGGLDLEAGEGTQNQTSPLLGLNIRVTG